MNRSHSLLRNTLRLDAAICVVTGLELALFSGPVSRLLGLDRRADLIVLGLGLLAYGAWLLAASRRQPIALGVVKIFIAADFAWIAGSALVIALGPLSNTGNWIVGVVAALVLAMAEAKMLGMRRLRRDTLPLALGRQAA